MPKSSWGPPGLWLAVRMKPPYASPPLRVLMTADAAGVDNRPPRPTQTWWTDDMLVQSIMSHAALYLCYDTHLPRS